MTRAEGKEKQPSSVSRVVFLIYNEHSGRFLLERRISRDDMFYGRIIIPEGKVEYEKGETPRDAFVREARKETGIDVITYRSLHELEDSTPNGQHITLYPYLILAYSGIVENNEPQKCEHIWANRRQAIEVLELPSSKRILKDALTFLASAEWKKG